MTQADETAYLWRKLQVVLKVVEHCVDFAPLLSFSRALFSCRATSPSDPRPAKHRHLLASRVIAVSQEPWSGGFVASCDGRHRFLGRGAGPRGRGVTQPADGDLRVRIHREGAGSSTCLSKADEQKELPGLESRKQGPRRAAFRLLFADLWLVDFLCMRAGRDCFLLPPTCNSSSKPTSARSTEHPGPPIRLRSGKMSASPMPPPPPPSAFVNGNGAASPLVDGAATNGDAEGSSKFVEGLIYPPPEIRSE